MQHRNQGTHLEFFREQLGGAFTEISKSRWRESVLITNNSYSLTAYNVRDAVLDGLQIFSY